MIFKTDKSIIEILKNIPIFQNLDEKGFKKIIPLLEPKSYPADSLIIKEGSRGDSMHVIVSGTVKVTKMEETKEEILIGYLYSGSFFGEFSLIDRMPRSANVITTTETKTLRLSKSSFDKLLDENIKISNTFYKNCLEETFSRFRNTISSFTFSQHLLKEKSDVLEEINRDLSAARKIQRYFINTDFLDKEHNIHDIKHSYIYNPCIDIGGDYLNIYEIDDDSMGIIIADFMGHGITAALGTGVIKSALSSFFMTCYDNPIELMKKLNNHFLEVIPKLYATCYYSFIDFKKGKMKMAKAGHPHPIFWKKKEQDFISIDCLGTGLGLVKDANFGEIELDIEKGDKILFFTDGIIEQHNPDSRMYSFERLQSKLKEAIEAGDEKVLDTLLKDLKDHSKDEDLEDDITMFFLEI